MLTKLECECGSRKFKYFKSKGYWNWIVDLDTQEFTETDDEESHLDGYYCDECKEEVSHEDNKVLYDALHEVRMKDLSEEEVK